MCSATGQSTKSAKITAARLALKRWLETFDYKAAVGKAYDPEKARVAAAFAAAHSDLADDHPSGRLSIHEAPALFRETRPVF